MEPKPKNDLNPFNVTSKYPVNRNVLIEEMIDGLKLCRHVKSSSNIEIVFSAIKQALTAVVIAQEHCKFTHYDLHSDNIILRKCDPDTVFVYVMDDERAIAVPSLGYYSTVIDFGFSYIDASDSQPFTSTLAHTEVGFVSDRFNAMADAKVLLISINEELKDYRSAEEVETFGNLVKNIFAKLNVHWDCGWDDNDTEGASYILIKKVQKKTDAKSKLFKKYGDYCMDILFSLIKLPLEENSTKELQLSYDIFVKEFSKIENEIQSSVYNLYILKEIVDSAREVEGMYLSNRTRTQAIDKFRLSVIDVIDRVSKFCSPKKVHYERMLCSLYSFADCANGYLYKIVGEQVKEKQKLYDTLPISSVFEIVNILNVNLQDTYIYNKKSKIVILDAMNKTRSEMSLSSEELEMVNGLPSFMRGMALAELYKQNDGECPDLSDESDIAGCSDGDGDSNDDSNSND